MMRPSHRLDVLAVPRAPASAPVEALRAFLLELVEGGVIDARGTPGPEFAQWMPEGFARLRLDIPGRIALYGNRQGGFRVFCPSVEGPPITAAFSEAYTGARHAERPDLAELSCPVCGQPHPLGETRGRPSFRFARVALQTVDAEALSPLPEMESRLRRVMGDIAWVGVRT